jgi:hypothetical protein
MESDFSGCISEFEDFEVKFFATGIGIRADLRGYSIFHFGNSSSRVIVSIIGIGDIFCFPMLKSVLRI